MTDKKVKAEGRIIKVHREKGYGFIISEEHKFIKFFFHWTALAQNTLGFKELTEGMRVKFIPVIQSNDTIESHGPRAVQIEVIKIEEKKNGKETD